MYKIEFYRLDVENGEFVFLGENRTFTGLYYDTVKNGIGTCVFNLNIFDEFAKPKYLQRYSTIVVVKKNGTCVWFGIIGNLVNSIEDTSGSIGVEAYTYLYFFKNRITTKEVIYTQEDQADIAWDLIDDSQNKTNGDLLITRGSYAASKDRDRTYNYYTISQALINLTNVIDGFDFSFDATFDSDDRLSGVKFNTYYPKQGRRRDDLGVLKIGENIQLLSWVTQSKLYNQVVVEGAGTGTPIVYEDGDSDMQKAYTRIERYEPRKDISEPDTLDEYGGEILNSNKVEGYKLSIRVNENSNFQFSNLTLGDSVLCTIDYGNALNFTKREGLIDKLRVNVDENGVDFLSFEIEIYG